jgi:signal recognition particle subunit SRP72
MSDPSAALASLLQASTIQDHDEVLKLANASIKASKGKSSLDAHHTRIVALLKLDRFEDALRAIADGGDALEARCTFEKSYALYKSGHLQEARDNLRKAPAAAADSRSFRHLRAQIAYRAESFVEASDLYRGLADEQADRYADENDIKINLLATNAQLEWAGLGHRIRESERQPARTDLEAFETAYNAACAHIARGELAKASVLLKRARDLCEASEDLSADEKKAELLPIMLQHIYVLSQLGKLSEATTLQKLVVQSEYVMPMSTLPRNCSLTVLLGSQKRLRGQSPRTTKSQ